MAHFSELHDSPHILLLQEQYKEGTLQNGNREKQDDHMAEELSRETSTEEWVFHKGLEEELRSSHMHKKDH
jgi:hypothetical protein